MDTNGEVVKNCKYLQDWDMKAILLNYLHIYSDKTEEDLDKIG